MSFNHGWYYYKEFYRHGKDETHITQCASTLLKARFQACDTPETSHGFALTTDYPGLLIGTGDPHGLKGIKTDFSAGMYFDHTTGIPLIPGSSVKGKLRSWFGVPSKNKQERYADKKSATIRRICENRFHKHDIDVRQLAMEIFEGIRTDGTRLGRYGQDRFEDAPIINDASRLYYDTYITAHHDVSDKPENSADAAPVDDLYKEPNPVRILKIAPGVTFRFSFRLHDGEQLTAVEKEMLFLELIDIGGMGAKTRTGFGYFSDASVEQSRKALDIKFKDDLSPVEYVLRQYNNKVADIIKAMDNGRIDNLKSFKVDLARALKEIMMQHSNSWVGAKGEALKRKNKVQAILDDSTM